MSTLQELPPIVQPLVADAFSSLPYGWLLREGTLFLIGLAMFIVIMTVTKKAFTSQGNVPKSSSPPTSKEAEAVVAAVETSVPVSKKALYFWFVLDLLFYAPLYYRPGGMGTYHMTVVHYFTFPHLTDIFALALPPTRRHWYSLFRALTSLQNLVYVFYLWNVHADGALELTLVRVVAMVLRLVHALSCIRTHGPTLANIEAMPSYMSAFLRTDSSGPRDFAAERLMLFPLVLLTGEFFYSFHWNYGATRIDGPTATMQSGHSCTNMLKTAIFAALAVDPVQVATCQFVSAALFVAQWFMMPEMYINAPLPYLHNLFDFAAVLKANNLKQGVSAGAPFARPTEPELELE